MKIKNLSNENKLLIFCLKTSINEVFKTKIRDLLNSNIKWHLLIATAKRHEILSFLYLTLKRFSFLKLLPFANLPDIKSEYYACINRNIRYWNEFCNILKIFKSNHIKFIPLKGIILTKTLYSKNWAMRNFSDIDILVQENDIQKASKCLLDNGYKKQLTKAEEKYYKRYHCHILFNKTDYNLELHWNLAPPRPNYLNLTDIWQRAKKIKVDNNIEVLTLTKEDTLISLILHICNNVKNIQRLSLKNFIDIYELISQNYKNFDWQYIIRQTKILKIKGNFEYVFNILLDIYPEIPISKEIKKYLLPPFIKRHLYNLLKINFFGQKQKSQFKSYLIMLLNQDTISDKLKIISLRLKSWIQKRSLE